MKCDNHRFQKAVIEWNAYNHRHQKAVIEWNDTIIDFKCKQLFWYSHSPEIFTCSWRWLMIRVSVLGSEYNRHTEV